MHTVSATITPNKSQRVYISRDNIHEISQVLAKHFQPECMRYYFNIFFTKSNKKSLYTKITLSVLIVFVEAYSHIQTKPVLKVLLISGGQVNKILFKSPEFVL